MRGGRLWILVGSLLGVCLLVTVLGSAVYFFLQPREEVRPAVMIKSPGYDEQVSANEITLVQAIARDPSGVMRVELWSDGELVAVKTSQLPEGSNPFPLIEGWQPESPGKHTLIVRAYNKAQRSGQASVLVEVLDLPKPEPTPVAHEVQAGDTLETIAIEYDVSAEDIAENNPGLEEPLEPGEEILIPPPPPEEEDPPRPEEAPPEPLPDEEPPEPAETVEVSPLLAIAGRLFTRPLISFISLELEGVYLEVDKEYNGVYCYASLAGSAMERVPAEGYLESMGERRWDIEAQMGGENRRIVSVPREEGRLDVRVNCIGYNESEEGGIIFDLGTLTASHSEEEWDGRLIEQMVNGLHGWFRVGYRIYPFGEREEVVEPMIWIDPPTNLTEGVMLIMGEGWLFGFNFDYPIGAEETIGGFHIFRNGALLAEVTHPLLISRYPDHNTWFAAIWQSDFYPACPNVYEFYMTAYIDNPIYGRMDSMPSNSVFTEGDPVPCYRSKVVRVTFEYLHTGCLDLDDYVIQRLCTTGQLGSMNQQMGREPCGCNHDPRDWPIPYGDVWVNGVKACSGLWQDFDSASTYEVGRFFCPSDLLLGPLDDLTITMKLWDPDVWSSRDLFCPGEYTIGHWELDELAKSPPGERKRTYVPEFSNDNGTCWLEFTVEVLSEW